MFFLQALKGAVLGTFKYSGRSDRLEQWTFAFVTLVAALAVFICVENGVDLQGPPALILFTFAFWALLAHVSLFVRRLHNMNRSGLFMLLPAAALTVFGVGWFGMHGEVEFHHAFFVKYGWWIMYGGRIALSFCGTFLLYVFLAEGDLDDNDYGEVPL